MNVQSEDAEWRQSPILKNHVTVNPYPARKKLRIFMFPLHEKQPKSPKLVRSGRLREEEMQSPFQIYSEIRDSSPVVAEN